MSAICLLIDVDGFSGRSPKSRGQILVPREIGIVCLRMPEDIFSSPSISHENRGLLLSQSLYFCGGITAKFRQENSHSFTIQSRTIHGIPQKDKGFRDAVFRNLTRNSLFYTLPPDPEEAAQEGIEIAATRLASIVMDLESDSPLILLHKGGDEGLWLGPLAEKLTTTRARPVTVVDLNSLCCPKVGEILQDETLRSTVEKQCQCSPDIHTSLVLWDQWTHHCPQAECLVFAEWILATCYFRDQHLARNSTLDIPALGRLIDQGNTPPPPGTWAAATPGTKEHKRCENFIHSVLVRSGKYSSPEDVLTFIAARRREHM